MSSFKDDDGTNVPRWLHTLQIFWSVWLVCKPEEYKCNLKKSLIYLISGNLLKLQKTEQGEENHNDASVFIFEVHLVICCRCFRSMLQIQRQVFFPWGWPDDTLAFLFTLYCWSLFLWITCWTFRRGALLLKALRMTDDAVVAVRRFPTLLFPHTLVLSRSAEWFHCFIHCVVTEWF